MLHIFIDLHLEYTEKTCIIFESTFCYIDLKLYQYLIGFYFNNQSIILL